MKSSCEFEIMSEFPHSRRFRKLSVQEIVPRFAQKGFRWSSSRGVGVVSVPTAPFVQRFAKARCNIALSSTGRCVFVCACVALVESVRCKWNDPRRDSRSSLPEGRMSRLSSDVDAIRLGCGNTRERQASPPNYGRRFFFRQSCHTFLYICETDNFPRNNVLSPLDWTRTQAMQPQFIHRLSSDSSKSIFRTSDRQERVVTLH